MSFKNNMLNDNASAPVRDGDRTVRERGEMSQHPQTLAYGASISVGAQTALGFKVEHVAVREDSVYAFGGFVAMLKHFGDLGYWYCGSDYDVQVFARFAPSAVSAPPANPDDSSRG